MFLQDKNSLSRRVCCAFLSLCLILSYFCLGVSARTSRPTPIDPDDYFGRTNLAALSNGKALVYAYDKIADGVENCEEEISVRSIMRGYSISIDEFDIVLNAYLRDYPHHFWIGNAYSYRYSGSTVISFIPSYSLTGDALTTARTAFDNAVESIMSNITTDMSEPEREKYLHDYLASNIVYVSADNAHNAYGALIEGQAVCEGYSEAFQYLLYQSGILSVVVTGKGYTSSSPDPEPHAWNLVRIDDAYYYVDLTWDDQTVSTFYAYYNITDEQLAKDHELDVLAYDLPACTATAANYFVMYGGLMDVFSVDTVVNSFHQYSNKAQLFFTDDSVDFWTEFSANRSAIVKGINTIGTPQFTCYSLSDERLVLMTGQRRGDVNGDSLLNSADLAALVDHLSGTTSVTDSTLLEAADVNQDGTVNVRDHQRLYQHITGEQYIAPAGNTAPPTAQGTAILTAQPAAEIIAASQGAIQAKFLLTLTPPENGSIGVCSFDIIPPAGTQLYDVTLNQNLLQANGGVFDTLSYEGSTIILSGSTGDKHITDATHIATVTLLIEDRSFEAEYMPEIVHAICDQNQTTACTLQYVCSPVVISDDPQPEDSQLPDSSVVSSAPQESSQPVVSSQPEDSSQPVASSQPSVSSQPIVSSQPTVSPQPTGSDIPSSASSTVSNPSEALKPGDLDKNGEVNAVDALMVLQWAVHKRQLTVAQQNVADLNTDGNINALDALIILQIAVGKYSL